MRVPVQLNSIAGINLVSLLFCMVSPLLVPRVHDSLLNVKHESTIYNDYCTSKEINTQTFKSISRKHDCHDNKKLPLMMVTQQNKAEQISSKFLKCDGIEW